MNIIRTDSHFFVTPIDLDQQAQRLSHYCAYETHGDFTVHSGGTETFRIKWTSVDYAGTSDRTTAQKMVSMSKGYLPKRGPKWHFDISSYGLMEHAEARKFKDRLVEIVNDHNGILVLNNVRSEAKADEPFSVANIGFKNPKDAMVWKMTYL